MIFVELAAVVVLGYLLGSIPCGVIVSKWLAKKDVRQYGSGKMGMTNVLRTAGKKAAILVFAMDLLKGWLAVWLARLIIGDSYIAVGGFALGALFAQCLAALAAIAGHVWPVFLKFRGGRGVVTFFGGLAALWPPAAIFGGEIFFIGSALTRYVSLGSMVGMAATAALLVPLTLINGLPVEYLGYSVLGALLVTVMHRDNISRLLSGRERKLGESAERRG
jgi:acyl phosphate:glycerol-3-phosphate acyltransferase